MRARKPLVCVVPWCTSVARSHDTTAAWLDPASTQYRHSQLVAVHELLPVRADEALGLLPRHRLDVGLRHVHQVREAARRRRGGT
eukprot:686784-Prymnesium_polylepis.1